MTRTTSLRRQHDAAETLIAKIRQRIAEYRGQADAYPLALELARLNGLLRIHFAQEDLSLYPRMVRSSDGAASRTALAFKQEMGALSATFEDYVRRWSTSASIAGDFRTFAQISNAVFDALTRRIRRENDVLYPLADSLRGGIAA